MLPSQNAVDRIKPELLATPKLVGVIALREGCTVAEIFQVMAHYLDERDFAMLLNGYVDSFEERLAIAEANYENMIARRDLLQAALDAERAAKC
jgi:hypothetical protein